MVMAMGTRRNGSGSRTCGSRPAMWSRPQGMLSTTVLNQILERHEFVRQGRAAVPEVLQEEPVRPAEHGAGRVLPISSVGYFEGGLDSERGIAWRTADSLSRASFWATQLDGSHAGSTPTISAHTPSVLALETHKAVSAGH